MSWLLEHESCEPCSRVRVIWVRFLIESPALGCTAGSSAYSSSLKIIFFCHILQRAKETALPVASLWIKANTSDTTRIEFIVSKIQWITCYEDSHQSSWERWQIMQLKGRSNCIYFSPTRHLKDLIKSKMSTTFSFQTWTLPHVSTKLIVWQHLEKATRMISPLVLVALERSVIVSLLQICCLSV